MQKALEEDSSVYEYDNVYDDIQKQRLETNKKLLGGSDRKVGFLKLVFNLSMVSGAFGLFLQMFFDTFNLYSRSNLIV